jgi:hypothetical protein
VDFHDGGAIEVVYPAYQIKGIVYDAKPRAEVVGVAKFRDRWAAGRAGGRGGEGGGGGGGE